MIGATRRVLRPADILLLNGNGPNLEAASHGRCCCREDRVCCGLQTVDNALHGGAGDGCRWQAYHVMYDTRLRFAESHPKKEVQGPVAHRLKRGCTSFTGAVAAWMVKFGSK